MKIGQVSFTSRGRKVVRPMASLFGMLLCIVIWAPQAWAAVHPRVLILSSYHRGHSWSDAELQGMEQQFAVSSQRPELYFEYYDGMRLPRDNATNNLYVSLQVKYPHDFFDVIVTADDHAFTFMAEARPSLFPGVPIVFCGVNRMGVLPHSELPEKTTGILDTTDIAGVLSLIAAVHPDVRNVVFISDNSRQGRQLLRLSRDVRRHFSEQFGFTELSNFSPKKLQAALRQLPQSSVLVLLSYTQDRDGKPLTVEECVQMIVEASPVPVYGVGAKYINAGLVGGMALSGFEHGGQAARLVERILQGTKPEDLPITIEPPAVPVLNYARFMASSATRVVPPANVRVYNKPESEERPWLIWGIAAAGGVILIFYGWFMWRRHGAAPTAQRAEVAAGAVAVIQTMRDVCLLLDKKGTVLALNTAAEEESGFDAQAAHGLIPEAILPMLAGALEKMLRALQEGKHSHAISAEVRMSRGARRVVLEGYALPCLEGGSLLVLRDVTDAFALEVTTVGYHRLSLIMRLVFGMCYGVKEALYSIADHSDRLKEICFEDSEGNIVAAAQAGCSINVLRTYLASRGASQAIEAIQEAAATALGMAGRMPDASRANPEQRIPLKDVVENALRLSKDDPRLRHLGIARVEWHMEPGEAQNVFVMHLAEAELVIYEMIVFALLALLTGEASAGNIRIGYGADAKGGYVRVIAGGCTKEVDTTRLLRDERMHMAAFDEMTGNEGFALAMLVAERHFGAPLVVRRVVGGVCIEFMLR